MAKVYLAQNRELEAGYHVYKQPSFAGDRILVRRKIAMPTDVEHRSSRATREQRKRFGSASRRWSLFPPFVKADLSERYAWVWRQHSLSTPVLLQGRQLFISQEIHAQEYHDEHAETPLWTCVLSMEPAPGRPTWPYKAGTKILPYSCRLRCSVSGVPTYVTRILLSPGNNLFYPLPPDGESWNILTTDHYLQLWPDNRDYRILDQLLDKPVIIVYPYFVFFQEQPMRFSILPFEPDCNYLQNDDPAITWDVNIHETLQNYPKIWYTEPAINLKFSYINIVQTKLTITPLYVRHHSALVSQPVPTAYVYWYIHPTGGGGATIDPPKHTLYFNTHTGKPIRYED